MSMMVSAYELVRLHHECCGKDLDYLDPGQQACGAEF